MRFSYQSSFIEATRRLSRAQASKLLQVIEKFQLAMESRQWPKGLGITHLRGDYFEFRVDIHTRVIYRRTADSIRYILYGSHDQVRQFLKNL